jgi:hypothetical protein
VGIRRAEPSGGQSFTDKESREFFKMGIILCIKWVSSEILFEKKIIFSKRIAED